MIRFIRFTVLVVSLLGIVSCSGSDSPATTLFDGSRSSLSNYYSETQLVATESLGVALNFGDDPPDVNGTFRLEPLVLQSSTLLDDPFGVGNTDTPVNIVFANQLMGSRNLDVSIVHDVGEALIEITDAVVTGSGNAFTVFALAISPATDGLETRMAFSGVLNEFGIANFQYAPFLVGGANDDIRLFEDADSLSERLEK